LAILLCDRKVKWSALVDDFQASPLPGFASSSLPTSRHRSVGESPYLWKSRFTGVAGRAPLPSVPSCGRPAYDVKLHAVEPISPRPFSRAPTRCAAASAGTSARPHTSSTANPPIARCHLFGILSGFDDCISVPDLPVLGRLNTRYAVGIRRDASVYRRRCGSSAVCPAKNDRGRGLTH